MDVSGFIARWTDAQSAERANYQLFLVELGDVLDLPRPEPASHDTEHNAYVFERAVPHTLVTLGRARAGDSHGTFV